MTRVASTTFIFFILFSACNSTNNSQNISQPAQKLYEGNNISIPVRIHLVKAQNTPYLNAQMSQNEVMQTFDIVNLIWKQAGITFEVESIVNLQASNEDQKQYSAAKKRNSKLTRVQKMQVMKNICDISEQSKDVLNLCVLGEMSNGIGGVFFGGLKPKVVWPIALQNGRKPLNPATLAHEFGHFIGLGHNKEKDIFLMRGSGNNMRRNKQYHRILLTKREVVRARNVATRLFH